MKIKINYLLCISVVLIVMSCSTAEQLIMDNSHSDSGITTEYICTRVKGDETAYNVEIKFENGILHVENNRSNVIRLDCEYGSNSYPINYSFQVPGRTMRDVHFNIGEHLDIKLYYWDVGLLLDTWEYANWLRWEVTERRKRWKLKPSMGISVTSLHVLKEYDPKAYNKLSIHEGVYVVGFTYRSSAIEGGIKKGDVITAINGIKIKSYLEYKKELSHYNPGEIIEVQVYRNDCIEECEVQLH